MAMVRIRSDVDAFGERQELLAVYTPPPMQRLVVTSDGVVVANEMLNAFEVRRFVDWFRSRHAALPYLEFQIMDGIGLPPAYDAKPHARIQGLRAEYEQFVRRAK